METHGLVFSVCLIFNTTLMDGWMDRWMDESLVIHKAEYHVVVYDQFIVVQGQ